MATAEDRAHAERLLNIYRRRLGKLEEKKAELGASADVSLDLEIDEYRVNVATLEALIAPKASDAVREAVKRNSEGDFDFTMLFIQGVQMNTRLTKVEERVDMVAQSQAAAQIERLQTREDIQDIKAQQKESERKRRRWQPVYLALWVAVALTIILALAFGRIYL